MSRIDIGGRVHNIVNSPCLSKSLNEKHASGTSGPSTNFLMENLFESKVRMRKLNGSDLRKGSGLTKYLMENESDSNKSLFSSVVADIKANVPNLVSFSSSTIDQYQWERMNLVSVIDDDGSPCCETKLFSIIRSFVGINLTKNLMGSSFMESVPSCVDDISAFHNKFNPIALGIPRWVPFPGLITGYAARRQLLQAMNIFHTVLGMIDNGRDPGFDWRDMDDVSDLMRTRSKALTDAGVSGESAAPEHLAVLWTINTKINSLIFWNIIYLLANQEHLSQVLAEIKPFCQASRPNSKTSGFGIQEPPRLSLNVDKTVQSCPLLKASYYETLRLQSCTFDHVKLAEDFILTGSDGDISTTPQKSKPYLLRKGEFVIMPHTLDYKNPRYFTAPEEYRPRRFLESEGHEFGLSGAEIAARVETAWPFNHADSAYEGQGFFEKTVLASTAAILATWDIQTADGRGWKVPKKATSFAVYEPNSDVSVKMKLKV